MHQPGGFLDQKSRSPASMGAAIAINGGVIAALLLAVPAVQEAGPKIIRLIQITPDAPPPERTPPPPQTETKIRPQPKSVITPTPSPVKTESDFVLPTLPPQPGTITGTELGTEILPPAQPKLPVLVGAKVNPRYADALQPPYPTGMQRIGKEGTAVVRVLIGADGRVKQVVLVDAADEAFFQATESQALRRWRFLPATRDGVAIEDWKTMTVRFRLND